MDGLTTAFVARVMRERGYTVYEGPTAAVTGGDADSRRIQPGQLFAAYPGDNTDGNLYVSAAFARGAAAAICSAMPEGDWSGRTIVVAPDTTKAAGELGAAWRAACPGPRAIGITGTVGKTTCKEMTAAVLASRFRTHKSEGGLNSRQGLPLAILSLRPEHDVSVLEMGMDSQGEIAELCAMARPTIGVVLNIGLTHIEKLGSIAAIAEEKLSLPRFLAANGTAVLNVDDERIAAAVESIACQKLLFGYGGNATGLRVADAADRGLAGTSFTVMAAGAAPVTVQSPIPGVHTIPGVVAAIGVAMALGMTPGEAAEAVRGSGVVGRTRSVAGRNGSTIIDDRYNSSPISLAGAIAALGGLAGGRRIALLGKMAELGPHTVPEHERAGLVASRHCDWLFTFGPMTRPLFEAARAAGMGNAFWFETKEEAAAAVATILEPGDYVLVKGSRSEALETILPLLEGAR